MKKVGIFRMSYIKLNPKIYPADTWYGGDSFEVIRFPVSSTFDQQNFDVRVSKTVLYNHSSFFTQLPNYQRTFVTLANQMTLKQQIRNQSLVDQLRPFQVLQLSGESLTEIEGIGSGFNLIHRNFVHCQLRLFSHKDCCSYQLTKQQVLLIVSLSPLVDVDLTPSNKYLKECITLQESETLLIWDETIELSYFKAVMDPSSNYLCLGCFIDFSYDEAMFHQFIKHYQQFDSYI